ncbi:fatty acid alpha-hydroxylase [Hypoxylon texense]
MSSDSSYRTRRAGGARLRALSSSESSDDSPSPRPKTKAPIPNIPTSQEIEAELMSASSAFGQELGSVDHQPTFPQSVQPTFYGYGRGRGPAPTGPNNVGNQLAHSRFPDEAPSAASSGFSRFSKWGSGAGVPPGPGMPPPPPPGPGMPVAGVPAGQGVHPGQDESIHLCRQLQGQIMTISQFVQRMPNVPAVVASQHQRVCQQISQGVNTVVHNLRLERDAARGINQGELHQRYQDALHAQASTEAERDNLGKRLKNSLEREKSTQRELRDWEVRVEALTKDFNTLEAKAKKFEQHHKRITADWEKQDKRSFKQIQALETEVKNLRARVANLAEKANVPVEEALNVETNDFPSPSVPSGSLPSHRSLDKEIKKDLLARLINPNATNLNEKESGDKDSGKSSSSSFKPNPKAPAWQPETAHGEKERYTTSPPDTQACSAVGGPSNWPVVVGRDQQDIDQYSITPGASTSSSVVVRSRQAQPPAAAPTDKPEPTGNASRPAKLARDKEKWSVQDVRDAVEYLYTMTKGYIVNCHLKAGDPPQVPYDRIEFDERPTWTYLLRLAYHSQQQSAVHMRYLLSIDSYRQHILMRVVLDYVFKKMLSPRIFLGISPELDNHLAALQDQIAVLGQPPEGSQTSTQARERQRVLDTHARVISHAMKSENADKFKDGVVKRHAEVLCRVLKPLRCTSADDDKAVRLLQLMTEVGWEISSKVWMSGMTLNFHFAECGSAYSFHTMDALNAGSLGYGVDELRNAHLRLSFVATPMLTIRDERYENKDVVVHGVKKMGILIMK